MDNVFILDSCPPKTVHPTVKAVMSTELVRHHSIGSGISGKLLHRGPPRLVSPSVQPCTTDIYVTAPQEGDNEEHASYTATVPAGGEDSSGKNNSAISESVARCESPEVELVGTRKIRGVKNPPSMGFRPGSTGSNGRSKPAPVGSQETASNSSHQTSLNVGQARPSLMVNATTISQASKTNESAINGQRAHKRLSPFSPNPGHKRTKVGAAGNVASASSMTVDPARTPSSFQHISVGLGTSGVSGGYPKLQSNNKSLHPSASPAAGSGDSSIEPQNSMLKSKKWTSRTWSASQYAALAQACERTFPFSSFEAEHKKSRADVLEVFTAIIQTPLLAQAGRGAGTPRSGLGEKLVKEHRKQEKDTSEYQAKLAALQQKDRDEEKRVMRQEVEREVLASLNAEGWIRAGREKEKEPGLGKKGNDGEANGSGGRATRGRRTARTRTVEEATAELQAASAELVRATKAGERRAKMAEKKERELGNPSERKVDRRRRKDKEEPGYT